MKTDCLILGSGLAALSFGALTAKAGKKSLFKKVKLCLTYQAKSDLQCFLILDVTQSRIREQGSLLQKQKQERLLAAKPKKQDS